MTSVAAKVGVLSVGAAAAFYAFYEFRSQEPKKHLNNHAFVFVKPHAVTDQVNSLVREEMTKRGIKILQEGELTSEEIDKKKLIDQHYYAIASKATILKPTELNIPADKFEKAFGLSWEEALKSKKVFNALDACKQLGITAEQMNELWAKAKKNGKLAKFGGGFYCGEIEYKKQKLFVFNGFFMEMRNAFTAPGRKIHYYDVEWDPNTLRWADFRSKVLGPTDPKEAPADSLRGQVLRDWKALGLKAEPNVGDNAVHASASPFEGMAERMNWLEMPCEKDDFCSALRAAGIPDTVIRAWANDPQVPIGEGKTKSLFDTLEDADADSCLTKALELSKLGSTH